MKLLTILGARPQFIKASSLSREIKNHSGVAEVIVHTGQHYDNNMSDVFFEDMKIPKPKYSLGVGGGSHANMTGQMMIQLELIMLNEKPDWVVVFGDTNSTLAGALTAAKLNIRIAHIEAGLRSFNNKMPEEINRIVTDRLSTLLFCPTETAVNNLISEGFNHLDCSIVNTGDIMKNGADFYSSLARKPKEKINNEFILATLHRAENTDNIKNISSIIHALKIISEKIQVVLPIHPRTLKKCKEFGIDLSPIKVIEPLGYLEMIWLIKNSSRVLTDSGGLQKEAFFFHKNCVTYREETEWIELVKHNFNVITGSDHKKIVEAVFSHDFNNNFSVDLYGTGNTSEKIISNLLKY